MVLRDVITHFAKGVSLVEVVGEMSNFKLTNTYMLFNDSVCTYIPSWSIHKDFIHGNLTLINYSDVIMGTMASQITSLTIAYSTVYPA